MEVNSITQSTTLTWKHFTNLYTQLTGKQYTNMAKQEVISLNFEQVAEQDRPIEKNDYHVVVKKFDYTPPKREVNDAGEKMYPYFKTVGEIVEGDYAGRKLYCNLTTNPEQTANGSQKNYMLYGFLKALGLASNESTQLSVDPNDVLNKDMTWRTGLKDEETTIEKFFPAV